MEDELLTYKVDGQTYDIPPDKETDFLAKYPKAEKLKSFIVGKDTFDIPEAKAPEFTSKYPSAVPTFGVKKKGGSTPGSTQESPSPPNIVE